MATDVLRWLAVAALVGVALFHGARLVEAGARHRRAAVADELTHAVMGLVMAAMLTGALDPADGRRLAIVFVLGLVWFVWRGVHTFVLDGTSAVGLPDRQAVGCAVMIYMLLVLSKATAGMPMGGASAMTSAEDGLPSPIVTATLVVATLVVAAASLLRPRAVGFASQPALAVGCQLAMNVATVYMLAAM